MARVNISLGADLWRRFRIACIEHGTNASREITRLITAQLEQWALEGGEKAED